MAGQDPLARLTALIESPVAVRVLAGELRMGFSKDGLVMSYPVTLRRRQPLA